MLERGHEADLLFRPARVVAQDADQIHLGQAEPFAEFSLSLSIHRLPIRPELAEEVEHLLPGETLVESEFAWEVSDSESRHGI